ncbi:MAG: tetratricopeptide repeat protein [Phycisphaerales bacterium]|nr:MAG: tetratricopeptide repeat protein [Phycisphaerales bacterium]
MVGILGCGLMGGAAALLLSAGAAYGQTGLGDGRGLERDMSRYGPGGPPPLGRDIMSEIRFRNAIVTGNAPGGASFRGNVGYTDPFEFRGGIGSDDLFAFRRDSMYSGLAGVGIRGTEALQYQFALATGSAVPQGLVGDLSMRRDGFRRLAGDLPNVTPTGPGASPLQRVDDGMPGSGMNALGSMDTRGRLLEMRSTSAYAANSGLRQELLGVYPMDDRGGQYGMIASPLRGIRPIPLGAIDPMTGMPMAEEDPGMRAREEARAPTPRRDDASRLPGMPDAPTMPGMDPLQGQGVSGRVDAGRQDLRLPTGTSRDDDVRRTPHDRVMDRLRGMLPASPEDPASGVSPTVEPLEERLDALRAELRRFEAAMEGRPLDGTRPGDPSDRERSRLPEVDLERPVLEDDDESREPDDGLFDPETLRLIRDSGGELDSLLPSGDVERDLFTSHMAAATRLMEAGRYFDAESRYITALAVRANDPSAMVGRVHAQLGAGLLDSAAVNLRALLTRHPEMAGVRYVLAARPTDERLEHVLGQLRERVEGASGIRESHATLLAYVAFQLGERETVLEAITLLDRADRERREAGGRGDPMPSFLRGIWIDRDPGPSRDLEGAPQDRD